MKRYRVSFEMKAEPKTRNAFVRRNDMDFWAESKKHAETEFQRYIQGAPGRSAEARVTDVAQMFWYSVTYRAATPEGPVTETESRWGISAHEVGVETQASVKDQFRAHTVKLLSVKKIGE